MKEPETKLKFIELRAQGLSYDKIAKQLKVSKQTLINWSKDIETEIANLKAIEIEGLLEKYYGLKREGTETIFKEKQTIMDLDLGAKTKEWEA